MMNSNCSIQYSIKVFFVLLVASVLFSVIAKPVFAEEPTQEQIEADEIKALEFYAKLFQTLESVKYATGLARDHVRATDLIEEASDKVGTGMLLRGVDKTLLQMLKDSDVKGKWVDRWEKRNNGQKIIRKTLSVVHGLLEFVNAVHKAETSTAVEKLESMAQIMKDISATFSSKHGAIDAYVKLLIAGVEGITKDVAVIEAKANKTTEIIAAIRKENMGADFDYSVLDTSKEKIDPIQEAIDKAKRRIKELENRAIGRTNEEAHKKIEAAQNECAKDNATTRKEMLDNQFQLGIYKRELEYLAKSQRQISETIDTLNLLITGASEELNLVRAESRGGATPEAALKAFNRIPSLEAKLKILQEEKVRYEIDVPKTKRELIEKYSNLSKKINSSQKVQDTYNECVKNKLKGGDSNTQYILRTYFPEYFTLPWQGWSRGYLYNSNDGECSVFGLELTFSAFGDDFITFPDWKRVKSVLLQPGQRQEVAVDSRGVFIRTIVLAHGTINNLADGWWFSSGCVNGSRPAAQCGNGKGTSEGISCSNAYKSEH